MLYMPGANARALEKARSIAADCLILDLEDSVAPDAKDMARDQVVAALKEGYGQREVLVRVNGLNSPWGHADLVATAKCGAHGVLLPKVESADAVRQAEAILEASGAPDDLAMWCMMETPRGILKAEEIALSSHRMSGFVMGTSDLAKDLQCLHTRDRLPMITSLGICLLVARAYGLAVLDGVYLDLNDDAGFEFSSTQGRELGFDGKTLIHPKTVEMTNRIFAPSAIEVEWSKKIIAAHAEASALGKGVVVVEGKLIENLHVTNARRLVKLAEMIEAMS
jgi:citrate lyase subunit beta/citryl-CoA lyase